MTDTGQSAPQPPTGMPMPPPTGEPAPVRPADREDVLGLRIGAALIDLVFVSVMFVVNGVTTVDRAAARGELATSDEVVILLLSMLFSGLFAYYFLGEAIFGRTLGKFMLGLRVARTDGGRASAWRIALRTVLRAGDWLPFAYVVGFFVMLATGSRRQRVGDLAADTIVVRSAVSRKAAWR